MSSAGGFDARAAFVTKRDGGVLSDAEAEGFVRGVADGSIADHQATAMLTAIFLRGMGAGELVCWTRAMLESGDRLSLRGLGRPVVDKHSTGGIGDKASLPLAPALAANGCAVPMISGRGLGHTGGTLDKLEAIPGFRTDVNPGAYRGQLERVGLVFGGQTARVVPADRKLYALRDVTGLVESIPLIASSILSKKLAEDLDALVLDVKFGSGAFLVEPERGAELARTMVDLARGFGLRAVAYQSAMDRPLGRAVGHALEVIESVQCMAGSGPPDLRELVCLLGGEGLALAGVVDSPAAGQRRIAASLDDGDALQAFLAVVEAQGGDPRAVTDHSLLPTAPDVHTVEAERDGTLAHRDARAVGEAVAALGGGRVNLGDTIDPAVGVVFLAGPGDRVARGQPIAAVHHRAGRGLDRALALLARDLTVGESVERSPLVLGRIE